ncbi:MAG: hypothetical protein B7Y99_07440 [Caulobacterales bacterium 32-69-10]|nr:MAG: hypothetical protein B7Y99_07440 [Caulobacterales bacterium 32-69-10]
MRKLGRSSGMVTGEARLRPSLDAAYDFDALLALTNTRLAALMPRESGDETGVLLTASRMAVLGQGKRVRPLITMLACAHAGGDAQRALDFGCAVEIVHAASLVLDDLPCMDDATIRRGAPTVHRAYGEDAAVLSAIALVNEAHRTILNDQGLGADCKLALQGLLISAIGFEGLAQGQMRDLRDGAEARTEHGLRQLNHLKTGALFVAACRGGGLIGGASPDQIASLSRVGAAIGFAFQLCDDLLDATATVETAGKNVAQDQGKLNFVDLWGPGRFRAAVRQCVSEANRNLGTDSPIGAYVTDLFSHAAFPG